MIPWWGAVLIGLGAALAVAATGVAIFYRMFKDVFR